jgi:hypothetical protein
MEVIVREMLSHYDNDPAHISEWKATTFLEDLGVISEIRASGNGAGGAAGALPRMTAMFSLGLVPENCQARKGKQKFSGKLRTGRGQALLAGYRTFSAVGPYRKPLVHALLTSPTESVVPWAETGRTRKTYSKAPGTPIRPAVIARFGSRWRGGTQAGC